jgi:putative ABC transport system permease protein
MDPNVPILTVQTLEEAAAFSLLPRASRRRWAASACCSPRIYGVTAFVVVARTREIGVRSALGAARTDVIAIVLRQGMMPVAAGVSIGLVLAGASVQVLMRHASRLEPVAALKRE